MGRLNWLQPRFSLLSTLVAMAALGLIFAIIGYRLREMPPDVTTVLLPGEYSVEWTAATPSDFRSRGLSSTTNRGRWVGGVPFGRQQEQQIFFTKKLLSRDHLLRGRGISYEYALEGNIFADGAYQLYSLIGAGMSAGHALHEKITYSPETRIITVVLGEESPDGFQILEMQLRVLESGELEFVRVEPEKQ
jgi:hypothetical protein